MSDRKVIAVVGATGAQGGGLVRAILDDPNGFAARVLTRDAGGAKAKDFARLGAEVVTADVDKPESLTKAFEGAYGAFASPSSGRTSRQRRKWRKHKQWR